MESNHHGHHPIKETCHHHYPTITLGNPTITKIKNGKGIALKNCVGHATKKIHRLNLSPARVHIRHVLDPRV